MNAIMKAKTEREEKAFRTSWEQTRVISYWTIVAMQGTDKFPNPESLFTLDWDKKKR